MCGIAGLYTKGGVIDNEVIKRLGISMMSRGTDSTGYVAKRKTGEIVIAKDILRADEFFEKHPLVHDYEWMFVHTRAATCGPVSVPNAHPFDVGNVIGLQNGFCFNHWAIADELQLPQRECDSHTVIDMINRFGDPRKFDRAWVGVIVYYLKREKTINVVGRLPMGYSEDMIGFASTPHPLVREGFSEITQEDKITLEG